MVRMRVKLSILSICLCLMTAHPLANFNTVNENDPGIHYVNSFIVEVDKRSTAEELAKDYGLVLEDEIPDLNLYHLVHPEIPQRSKRSADDHVDILKADERVKFVEQQQELVRVKREIVYDKQLELPDRDISDKSQFYRVQPRLMRKDDIPGSKMNFSDPYFSDQWYIDNYGQSGGKIGIDLNMEVCWKNGITGKGVVVCVLDDGIDHSHCDLVDSYDPQASADFNDKDDKANDPMPNKNDASNSHGTKCAGEIVAKPDNGICGVGIAYGAKIGGIRLLDGRVTDSLEGKALIFQKNYVDIYTASWGPRDDGATMEGPRETSKRALEEGCRSGRDGKGSIYIWATGNGGPYDDDCGADGYVSSKYSVSIGSINDRGEMPYFMEVCSSTMAVVPSGGELYAGEFNSLDKPKLKVVTTDINGGCTLSFEGTSSAAPLAAGCSALVLEANPDISWRDMQHIVAEGARIPSVETHVDCNNPKYQKIGGPCDPKRPKQIYKWLINGGGYHTNPMFGFGLLDCGRMVQLALDWKTVPVEHICQSQMVEVNKNIPSTKCIKSTVIISRTCAQSGQDIDTLEHVQLYTEIDHSHRGDIEIFLTSPMGSTSQMLSRRPRDNKDVPIKFTFMTIHHWGENPAGSWEVKVCDNPGDNDRKNVGHFNRFHLTLNGYMDDGVKRGEKKFMVRNKDPAVNIADVDDNDDRKDTLKKAFEPSISHLQSMQSEEFENAKRLTIDRKKFEAKKKSFSESKAQKEKDLGEKKTIDETLYGIINDFSLVLNKKGFSEEVVDVLKSVLDQDGSSESMSKRVLGEEEEDVGENVYDRMIEKLETMLEERENEREKKLVERYISKYLDANSHSKESRERLLERVFKEYISRKRTRTKHSSKKRCLPND